MLGKRTTFISRIVQNPFDANHHLPHEPLRSGQAIIGEQSGKTFNESIVGHSWLRYVVYMGKKGGSTNRPLGDPRQ